MNKMDTFDKATIILFFGVNCFVMQPIIGDWLIITGIILIFISFLFYIKYYRKNFLYKK